MHLMLQRLYLVMRMKLMELLFHRRDYSTGKADIVLPQVCPNTLFSFSRT